MGTTTELEMFQYPYGTHAQNPSADKKEAILPCFSLKLPTGSLGASSFCLKELLK